MSETLVVKTISRRQALSRFGLAAALLPAMALGVSGAQAQTPGMERRQDRRDDRRTRREDRRDDRQGRREDRREGRWERRDDRRGITGSGY